MRKRRTRPDEKKENAIMDIKSDLCGEINSPY